MRVGMAAALLLVTLLVGVGLGMQKGLRETDPRRPIFCVMHLIMHPISLLASSSLQSRPF